jgi:hypothetical protein
MSEPASPFEYGESFEPGQVSAGVHLGPLEAHYEELFAEVIEDGVITPEERTRLERAAAVLGLDRGRLQKLERALTSSYEARRKVRVHELPSDDDVVTSAPPLPRPSAAPVPAAAPAEDPRVAELTERVRELEACITDLLAELEDMRGRATAEVDVSGVPAASAPACDAGDPEELARRLRPDPRDADLLRALFRAMVQRGETDRAWCAARVLVYTGGADDAAREMYERLLGEGLVRPRAALSPDNFRKLLVHPDQEPLVGEIFGAVLGPVLLGRLSALRRDGALPVLDPALRHDPLTSTVSAVRSFTWAAAILGVQLPPLYADPSAPEAARIVPATAPGIRIGKQGLGGRSPAELAFLAGERLAYFRDDVFVRALFDGIVELEDVFLAALSIGNRAIPMTPAVRARVAPLADAIEPMLDPVQADRLRAAFLRFVEEGGRTNLQRWAGAVDATAARAGLLVADDLAAAEAILKLDDPGRAEEKMNDLLLFAVSERYAKLRRQIGVDVSETGDDAG